MHEGHNVSHDHSHNHDHNHDHSHEEASCFSSKDLALLKYMLAHNKQHADELSATGDRIKATGINDAAEKISDAVDHFIQANNELEKAIGILEGN